MESRGGGLGKSAFDKKPLGELYGNKDVYQHSLTRVGYEEEGED